MRKQSFIALLLVLVMLLAACGNGDNSTTHSNESNKEQTQTTTTGATTPSEGNPDPTEPKATEPEASTPPVTEPPIVDPVPNLSVEDLKTVTYNMPDYSNYNFTLTEVGSFERTDGMYVYDLPIIYHKNGDIVTYELLSLSGENLLGKEYHNYHYYGNGITGAYTFSQENPPVCDLVNAFTGETILSDNATKIEPISDRYLYVIFATEQTDNENECFIYFTDNMFSFGGPSGDDIMYKGYAKVYDLEKHAYVEGLMLEKPYDVTVCGTTLCVVASSWYGVSELYFEDGTCVKDQQYLYAGENILMQKDYSTESVIIYDCNMVEIITYENADVIANSISGTGYSDQYLKFIGADGKYGVMDMQGNEVLPAIYKYIESVSNDLFIVTEYVDEKYNRHLGIVASDGTEVVPCEYSSIYLYRNENAYCMYDFDQTRFNYFPGCGILCTADYYNLYNVYEKKPGDGGYSSKDVLIWDDFSHISLKYPARVGRFFVRSDSNGGEIYDIIHGDLIYGSGFSKVEYTSDYLYILADGVWTYYKVEIQ